MYLTKTKNGSVIEVRGWWRRKLFINGYPQTQQSYRSDWATILHRSGVDDLPHIGSALVLGLGGGDLAHILDKVKPVWMTVFVELESDVVKVAEKYFGIGTTNKRKIVTTDAKKYMERNREMHDLVIVDLYNGDDVPMFVSSEKFIGGIAKAIKPRGKVIINYASHSFCKSDFAKFEQKLEKYFSVVKRLKTWGHTYFLASEV